MSPDIIADSAGVHMKVGFAALDGDGTSGSAHRRARRRVDPQGGDELPGFGQPGVAERGAGDLRRLEDQARTEILAPGFPAELVDDEPEAPGHEVVVSRG